MVMVIASAISTSSTYLEIHFGIPWTKLKKILIIHYIFSANIVLHKKHIFTEVNSFHRVIYCSLILQWFKNDGNVMAAVSNLDDYDCKMWVIESDPYTRLFLKLPYIWFALYPFNPRSLYFSHRFSFLLVQIVERKVCIIYFAETRAK